MQGYKVIRRDIQSDNSLNGLITYFNEQSNLEINSILKANASSFMSFGDGDISYNLEIPLFRNDDGIWESNHTDKDPFYSVLFLKHQVYITGYGLKMLTDTELRRDFPKSWKFYGSNDFIEWSQLDFQPENDYFKDFGSTKNFPVDKTGSYRFFKIHQIGTNHQGTQYFSIKHIEIYGTMHILSHPLTCRNIINRSYLFISLLAFII